MSNDLSALRPEASQSAEESGAAPSFATPPVGAELLCLVCAYRKPWGIFDNTTGAAVCVECRDAAHRHSPEAPPQPTRYDVGAMEGGYHQIITPTGEPFYARVVALVPKIDDAYLIRDALNAKEGR